MTANTCELRSIRIKNFRAFGDEVELKDLTKITLIAGPNNIGKSSLLMPLRRLTRMDERFVPRKGNPDGIGLLSGSHYAKFQDSDFRSNTKPEISINLELQSLPDILAQALADYDHTEIRNRPGLQQATISLTTSRNYIDFSLLDNAETLLEGKLPSKKSLSESVFNVAAESIARTLSGRIIYVPALRQARYTFNQPDVSEHEERRYDGESLLADLLSWYLPSRDTGEQPDILKAKRLDKALSEIFETKVRIWPTIDQEIRIALGHEPGRNLAELGQGILQTIVIVAATVTTSDPPILLLEEPENCLHPGLQRQLVDFLAEQPGQFFITTHSNHLIDGLQDRSTLCLLSYDTETSQRRVQAITTNSLRAYSELGVTSGSIAASTTTLWVEGPSDAIYLRYWISQYDGAKGLLEGRDFTFAFHGGALLAHVNLDGDELVKLLLVHPGFFLIADSDRRAETDEPSHPYLKRLLLDDRISTRIWVTLPKEIEGYVSDSVFMGCEKATNESQSTGYERLSERLRALGYPAPSSSKVELARKAVTSMRESPSDKHLESHDLKSQLERVVGFIRACRKRLPSV